MGPQKSQAQRRRALKLRQLRGLLAQPAARVFTQHPRHRMSQQHAQQHRRHRARSKHQRLAIDQAQRRPLRSASLRRFRSTAAQPSTQKAPQRHASQARLGVGGAQAGDDVQVRLVSLLPKVDLNRGQLHA